MRQAQQVSSNWITNTTGYITKQAKNLKNREPLLIVHTNMHKYKLIIQYKANHDKKQSVKKDRQCTEHV